MKKTLLAVATIATFSTNSFAQNNFKVPETEEELGQLVEDMMKSIRAVKTAKFTFLKDERYEGKVIKSEQTVKLNVYPKKVYMKLIEGPHSGTELLYIDGKNENKAIVSAGSFVPNINLSPYSSLVTEKQRHTIYELGFLYTGDLIYDAFIKYKDKAKEYAKYEGLIDYDGRKCHKITLDNKEYRLIDYTVKKGDNLIGIARRNKLDEYSIKEYNKSLSSISVLSTLKEGQVIKIPNTFCKTVTMYVDARTLLPVYQKIYDQLGFVAEYQYRNLQINPTIAEEEFTKDYKGYGF